MAMVSIPPPQSSPHDGDGPLLANAMYAADQLFFHESIGCDIQ
jgi:hypothetical protein